MHIPRFVARPARAALAALFVCVAASGAPAQQDSAAGAANVVFLHWNDFHGQFRPQPAPWKARAGDGQQVFLVGGAASLAAFVARERAAGAARGVRVVVTDGGDWFQGTIEGNETLGRLSLELFERLGVEATVIGNHEYDFGPDLVKLLCKAARFPVLGANIVVVGASPRRLVDYVEPFCVVDVHGVRLALIGLADADTKSVSTGPWGEAQFEDEVAALRRTLPAARAASDVVMVLSHGGLEVDRQLARAFPEIPLILGGHSHTGLREPLQVDGSGTWIVQTYGKASGIYRIEARADPTAKTIEPLRGGLIELDHEKCPPDPAIDAWVAAETADIAAHWDEQIGVLATDLDDSRGARSSAAGNLVCDVFVEATGAQLAFTNKGGLRARLRKGPLTRRMVYELLPFENELVSMDLTGAQVRAVLAQVVTGRERLLEIGGGTYRYAVVDGERELGEVMVRGAPLEDGMTYRVATSSFLARGGDGLTAFMVGVNRVGHGLLLRDVLIRKAERDGRLVADETNRILLDRK